jgi:serine/threonine-protein phosphatase 2A regulatory subunit A
MDLMDDEEEVLLELAAKLDGSFLDYIGGPMFSTHLLKPLERLCEVEESTVRGKAVESIKNVLSLVNMKEMKQ